MKIINKKYVKPDPTKKQLLGGGHLGRRLEGGEPG
jgi:hypothetical protein